MAEPQITLAGTMAPTVELEVQRMLPQVLTIPGQKLLARAEREEQVLGYMMQPWNFLTRLAA